MQQRGLKPTASTLGQRLGRGGGQVQRAERPSRMGFEGTLGPALQRALLAAPGAGTQRLRGPSQAAGAGGGPDKRAGPQSGSRGCTRNPATRRAARRRGMEGPFTAPPSWAAVCGPVACLGL